MIVKSPTNDDNFLRCLQNLKSLGPSTTSTRIFLLQVKGVDKGVKDHVLGHVCVCDHANLNRKDSHESRK